MKSSHLLTRTQWDRFAKRILKSRRQRFSQGQWIGIYEADVLRALLTLTKPDWAVDAFDTSYPTVSNRDLGRLSPYECARHVWFRYVTRDSVSPASLVHHESFSFQGKKVA